MSHPNSAFEWTDGAAMLAFVAERAFAHIFTAAEGEPFVVHAPVIITASGRAQFHVARRNRAAEHLPGRRVLISVAARDGYQSANWYASDNQVPTWHHQAVELEGAARLLADEELVTHLDALTEHHEARHSPERPWTRAKMTPGTFAAMTRGLIGLEVEPVALRGTRKFNQHKSVEDHLAAVAGQAAAGCADIVSALREGRPAE